MTPSARIHTGGRMQIFLEGQRRLAHGGNTLWIFHNQRDTKKHCNQELYKRRSVQLIRAARFCLLLFIGVISLPQNQYIISLSDLRERVANIMQTRK